MNINLFLIFYSLWLLKFLIKDLVLFKVLCYKISNFNDINFLIDQIYKYNLFTLLNFIFKDKITWDEIKLYKNISYDVIYELLQIKNYERFRTEFFKKIVTKSCYKIYETELESLEIKYRYDNYICPIIIKYNNKLYKLLVFSKYIYYYFVVYYDFYNKLKNVDLKYWIKEYIINRFFLDLENNEWKKEFSYQVYNIKNLINPFDYGVLDYVSVSLLKILVEELNIGLEYIEHIENLNIFYNLSRQNKINIILPNKNLLNRHAEIVGLYDYYKWIRLKDIFIWKGTIIFPFFRN